jgi:hypothetical protein
MCRVYADLAAAESVRAVYAFDNAEQRNGNVGFAQEERL